MFSLLDMNYCAVEESPPTTSAPLESALYNLAAVACSDVTGIVTWCHDGSNGRGHVRVPLTCYESLVELVRLNMPSVTVHRIVKDELFLAEQARAFETMHPPSPAELKRKGVTPFIADALEPFQRKTIDFVEETEGKAYIADDMGLGKTVQGIAAMTMYRSDWPLLVVCPSGAKGHWTRELDHWLAESVRVKELDGTAINYETIDVAVCSTEVVSKYVKGGVLVMGAFLCIIVDEAHLIKNEEAAQTRALVPLLRSAKRVILLSGTPAFSKPEELWPQLYRLNCFWDDRDKFWEEFCNPSLDGERSRLLLNSKLRGTIMVRRTKADMKRALPEKRRHQYVINPSASFSSTIQPLMERVRSGKGQMASLIQRNSSGQHVTKVDTPTRLTDDIKNAVMECWKQTGRSKVPAVVSALTKWLQNNTQQKICIFGHHSIVLDAIQDGAGLSKNAFIRIDSKVQSSRRRSLIDRFQDDPNTRVALLGLNAASVALSLTASSTVWFAELAWSPSCLYQAEDRCCRMGQASSKVDCLYFIAKDTLDMHMWDLIQLKFKNIGQFVDGKEDGSVIINNTYYRESQGVVGELLAPSPSNNVVEEGGAIEAEEAQQWTNFLDAYTQE